jgi:non-specific serine/threonine protein kinase
VFAGSFTLEAAARVCLDEEEPRALELVERLVDASLVIAEARGSEMSYRLLETVRQYAEERLSKAGAREEFLRRHAEYFLRVAESASVAIDTSGPQRHELVLAEPHNLRAALNWATRADPELGLRLAAALHYFWMAHDPNEGIRRLEALLARAPSADPGLRARALLSFGACLSWAGEPDSARAAFAESRTLYQTLGDEWGLTECTFRLGFIDAQQDGREPRDLFEEALQEWRRLQHATGELRALADLGAWEFEHGDWARGKELTEESLSLARRVGSSWTEAAALGQLALRSLEVGRVEEGERWALDYLSLAREIASRTDLFLGLGMLAWAARERGDVERAVTLWAALESEETRAPVPLWPERRAIYETHIPLEPRPAAVLAFEDAVEYALSAAVR